MTARHLADSVTVHLARLLVRVFFRSVEVTGNDHVVAAGPLIEVANHQNGLVDGLVLIAASRRYPRFLGKSTLWKILPLRPFLALAGVVPVYRSADTADHLSDGERSEHNLAALVQSRDLLAAGGTIGVFPEGVSHDLASLQDLRTGAARLALGAATDGVVGLSILPVGIIYDDKARFRSRVLVRFGPRRSVDGELDAYRRDPRGTVRRLTADIAVDLRAVGPDYGSVEAAARFARLAALATTDPGLASEPSHDGLAGQDAIARRLAAADADPATRPAVERLERLRTRYEAGLREAGLDDAALRAGQAPSSAPSRRRVLGPLPDLFAVPLTGMGIAVHALPYSVIRVLGELPPNRGMRATVKLLGSFGLYSLTYLVLASVVGRRRGVWAAFVALLLGPLSGWVALRTLEQAEDLGVARRAAVIVGRRRSSAGRLASQRLTLVAAICDVAGEARPPARR